MISIHNNLIRGKYYLPILMKNSGFQDADIVVSRVQKNGIVQSNAEDSGISEEQANEILTLDTRFMIFDHSGNVVNIPLAYISSVSSAQDNQVNNRSAIFARIQATDNGPSIIFSHRVSRQQDTGTVTRPE